VERFSFSLSSTSDRLQSFCQPLDPPPRGLDVHAVDITLMIYQLPETVDTENLRFVMIDGSVAVTDRKGFTMNLSEHSHDGRM
jgi:hypothetical protein